MKDEKVIGLPYFLQRLDAKNSRIVLVNLIFSVPDSAQNSVDFSQGVSNTSSREMEDEGHHPVPCLHQPNSISTVERPPNSSHSSFFQTYPKPKPPFSLFDCVDRVSASH